MKYKLYHLINPITDTIFYVGMTSNSLKRRLWGHLSKPTRKFELKKWNLIKSIRDNGKMPIISLVRDNIDEQDIIRIEAEEIRRLKFLNVDLFNISSFGRTMSDYGRQRVSEKLKGNKHAVGIVITDAHKNAIREGTKKRIFSEEARLRISKSKQGKNNPMFGKEVSSETRKRLSDATKGRPRPYITLHLSKKVKQLTKDGKFVTIWSSIREAAKNCHVHESNISEVCNNNRKTAGGFKWELVIQQ